MLIRTTDRQVRVPVTIHSKQAEFIKWEDYVVALIWGRGTGKSVAGAIKVLERRLRHPKSIGLAGASTHQQVAASTQKHFIALLRKLKIPYERNKRPKDPELAAKLEDMGITDFYGVVTLPNGSIQVFRSLGKTAFEALRGGEYADIWFDEARELTYLCFQTLAPCLRGYGDIDYQIIITTSPKGFNWIYEILADEASDKYVENSRWSHATSRANPFNPADFVSRLLGSMTAKMAAQEVDAVFTSITGAVWPEFVPEQFPRGSFLPWEFDPLAQTFFSIDFGYRSPAIIVVQEIRPKIAKEYGIVDASGRPLDNCEVVIDEWLPFDTRLDQLTDWLLRWENGENQWDWKGSFDFGAYDPAGDNVNQDSGKRPAQELRVAGLPLLSIPSLPKYRSVSWGCEVVGSRFQNARGERRLFVASKPGEKRRSSIVPGCTSKFLAYCYPEDEEEKPVDEKPVKGGAGAPDHAADALRYLEVLRHGSYSTLRY